MIVGATGHRPEKLGGYGTDAADRLEFVAYEYLEWAGITHGISGMALGWDQAFARACVALGISWTAAIPFDGQESRWPAASQAQYRVLIAQASEVVIVSPGEYAARKMHVRNEWMMDRCEGVAAIWDGTTGGTAACLSYAKRIGRPVANLYPRWKRLVG